MGDIGLAGFGSAGLNETLEPQLPVNEPIEVHVLYTASANAPLMGGVWCVLDFMDFNQKVVVTIKNEIAKITTLKLDRIHILTTHNHGAGVPKNIEAIAALTATAAKQAMDGARPALVRGVQVKMPRGINMLRRIYVPAFKGKWTTFAGPDMESRRSAAGFIQAAVHKMEEGRLSYFGWESSNAVNAPEYEPGDPDFFLMEFKDAEDGRMLGTLSRFAMHAIMRSNAKEYYSSDFPWHLRECASRLCGGSAVFMNGPCGEVAPCFPWPDKSTGLERKYAEEMIAAALKEIETLQFEPLATRHGRKLVPLPIRQEVLDNQVNLPSEMPPATDLPARKRYLEQKFLQESLAFLREKHLEGEIQPGKEATIELGILQLGQWLVVAYPGETFWETGRTVAMQFPELKLVSVTEHGRTLMYLPPKAEAEQGGYEAICSCTVPGAEELVRNGAIELIKETCNRMHLPEVLSVDMLKDELAALGIKHSDTLLIHSAYKSIGNVEGGPSVLLDMLMDYFKDEGLLAFPTLTYNCVAPDYPYDVRNTPSCVGILPQMFRSRPGVYRSLHPTHSMAAYGHDAATFAAGDELFDTPCAKGSTWWKLVERGGKILFIGTGLENNTFGHGTDEWLNIPGMRREEPMPLPVIDYNGRRITVQLHRHCAGRNALFASQEMLFMRTGALKQGYFGNAACFVLDCRKAVQALGIEL